MSAPSALTEERVRGALATRRYGRSLELREATTSTNDDGRKAALAGAERGHVIVADAQSQGRGSSGRSWASPPGEDLYVSIVERPEVALATLPTLTLAVGLGVSCAVDALLSEPVLSEPPVLSAPDARSPLSAQIKWPNDVWLRGKKVAGVLVEVSTVGENTSALVIGIGLNVNRTAFSPELSPSATSLALASGQHFDRAMVLATLLDHVERAVERWLAEGPTAIVHAVNERLALRGEAVLHDGEPAVLLGLSPSGALRLQTARGPEERLAGRLLPAVP